MTAAFQGAVFGTAILRDSRAKPRCPRWVGYLNIWICMRYVPATFCVLTKTGPIAWNGLISWWLAAVTYFIWTVGVTYSLLKTIKAEKAEVGTASEAEILERIALDIDRERGSDVAGAGKPVAVQ